MTAEMFKSEKADEGSVSAAEAKPEAIKEETETDESASDAGETDGAAETEENDESATQGEDKGAEGDEKLFNEKQQAIFNKRVGKEVEKRKALESELEKIKAEAAEAKAKADPELLKVSEVTGIPPAYLSPTEAKVLAEDAKWREIRDFCRNHKQGYVGNGGNDKDMNTDEIHAWHERAMDHLMEVGPEAKSIRRAKLKEMEEHIALGRKLSVERSKAVQKKIVELKKPAASTNTGSGAAPASNMKQGKMTGETFAKLAKAKGGESAALSFFGSITD